MTRPNIVESFRLHRKMSMITGIWPIENPDIFYRLRTYTTWFFSVGLTLCMMLETFNDLNDITKLSKIIYIMITYLAYIAKLIGLTYNQKILVNVLDFLKDPIFLSFPENFDHILSKAIKYFTILANMLFTLFIAGSTLFSVYPIMDNIPLPFPFPYDLGNYRLLMFAFQSIGEVCAAWNNGCLDTIAISLIGMATVQLDILGEKLMVLGEQKVSNDPSDKKVSEYVKQCVKHHVAIIKLIEQIEQMITAGLLVQLFASIVISCITAFQFIWVPISWELFLLSVYFVALSTQLFMYCWFGNELIVTSLKVGDACYMSNWYECDKEVRQYLFIIMERCKRPLKISTMKFSVLSLASFLTIAQWSYSILTLLLNMYKKKEVD